MDTEQYKVLVMSLQHELKIAKDDYKQGRIDINCLQYVAKRLQGLQTQIEIEAKKNRDS